MSPALRVVASCVLLAAVAAPARAAENPPDSFLCYLAGSAKNKKLTPISGAPVEVRDRFGDASFVMRRLAALCNPASLDGEAVSHDTIHLVGITIKKEKTAPKFVPFTVGVSDRFGTRQLELGALAAVLDVTPVQPGTNVPADFNDDPTRSAVEVNRFKCYAAAAPKGAPRISEPAPITVRDEGFPGGQAFRVRKPTKVCFPADVDGGTPGAETRGDLLVCWSVKLPKGAKFVRQTVGTRSRSVGVRIVGRRKPSEICFAARLFPGG
ncbi:MAG: hypothetical protein IT293_22040 [Deltaproteobacteria bacterium]|nr:hypothetical protein [Deltaproteobacteria bacterium]